MKHNEIPKEEPDFIDDPQWYRNFDPSPIGADQVDHDSATPAIRVLGGGLDFLHGIESEFMDWFTEEIKRGRKTPDQLPEWIRKNLPYQPNKVRVTADVEAAEDIDLSTYVLGSQGSTGYTLIVRPRQDRFRVIVTNWGPNIIYVSHQTNPGANVGGMNNAVQIAVNASRTFQCRTALYAYPTTGSAPVVDVQDEFGYRS